MYEACPCTLSETSDWRAAISALKFMLEGLVAFTNGILSMILVMAWLSWFQFRFRPYMVLTSGSSPMVTLLVSGFSFRCMNVPPIWKLGLKSYIQLSPAMVLRCMLYSVLLSNCTLTLVPASIMLWLMMVTVPML